MFLTGMYLGKAVDLFRKNCARCIDDVGPNLSKYLPIHWINSQVHTNRYKLHGTRVTKNDIQQTKNMPVKVS